ncbi:HAD-IA family hydrolase [Pseudomonas typographi]|uniref:HAD-IA family hydrolase n=1 Tax=Pseudomonas typographi TaxID=2715964 RepID=A0ABR7Z2B5_9PSED|nr:HAD-IA family hydrolase [Pseudomonas typographi]MBD1552371.1 HAD-IA family hydrolase [Pseudomonas typographi]MBD1587234.1 HAD-IA family hydrolase [Pseudomonas typographi]MBD1599549.1 HAD-IA family hydrolase [Pseudomonas typographi]
MASIDLLICDCDGVLIDSEIVAERNLRQSLAQFYPADELNQVLEGTFGLQSRDILKLAEHYFGRPLPAGFVDNLHAHTEALIRSEVQPIPGVRDALLAIELPLAVASNSRLDGVQFALKRAGLVERVNAGVYSAEQVALPKPAPDVYLAAAKGAGASPGRCLVVEDSVTGATAALAAGMRVLGFLGASHIPPGHGQRLLELGVERTFTHMRELPQLVATLNGLPAPLPPH